MKKKRKMKNEPKNEQNAKFKKIENKTKNEEQTRK